MCLNTIAIDTKLFEDTVNSLVTCRENSLVSNIDECACTYHRCYCYCCWCYCYCCWCYCYCMVVQIREYISIPQWSNPYSYID